jgi:hypothetical protein
LHAAGAPAAAQSLEIGSSSIDGGGGVSTGGAFTLRAVIGQHDAGSPAAPLAGGDFVLVGGFLAAAGSPCVPDFNGDGSADTRDVLSFLNAWNLNDPRADMNGDGAIDTRDVLAFLNLWVAGCA